jgi:hypothetical protein
VVLDESHPEPSSPLKYPAETRKKKKPACPWLIANSFSIVGNNGEKTIREMKLSKKINVRNATGPTWRRKGTLDGVELSRRGISAVIFCAPIHSGCTVKQAIIERT